MNFKEKIEPLDKLFESFYMFSPVVSGILVYFGVDLKILWLPLVMLMLWTIYIYFYRARYVFQDYEEHAFLERARGYAYFFGLVLIFFWFGLTYFFGQLFQVLILAVILFPLMFLIEIILPKTIFSKQAILFDKSQKRMFRSVLSWATTAAMGFGIIVALINFIPIPNIITSNMSLESQLNIVLILVCISLYTYAIYRQENRSREKAESLAASLKGSKWLRKYSAKLKGKTIKTVK